MNRNLYIAINTDPYRDCYIDNAEVTVDMMYHVYRKAERPFDSSDHVEAPSPEVTLKYWEQRREDCRRNKKGTIFEKLKKAGYYNKMHYCQAGSNLFLVYKEKDFKEIASIVSQYKSYKVKMYQDWWFKKHR